MLTRKGVEVPDDLAQALATRQSAVEAFGTLKPSCQQGFVIRIEASVTPQVREQRVAKVVDQSLDWKRRYDVRKRARELACI